MYLAGTALVGLARRGGCFFVSYILAALGWMATFPSCTYIVDGYISYQLHNVLFFFIEAGGFFPASAKSMPSSKDSEPGERNLHPTLDTQETSHPSGTRTTYQ